MSRRSQSDGDHPGGLMLVEEAVHLLRRAPAGTLALYVAGTAPFVLGLLFFWAYMTWFTPPSATMAWAACGLVLLFAAMKAAHAEFCSRLMAQRLGAAPPGLSFAGFGALCADQLRIQAWGLVVLPLAAASVLPFGWAYAYFQSASVLGSSRGAGGVAFAQAKLWPAQNLMGLLFLFILWAVALVNLGSAFWLAPWLANRILGIENAFGFSGWWRYNTTFLASVATMAWLVADPLVKSFYTLRVFYGRARVTGEDLRVEFRSLAAPVGKRVAVALLLLIAVAGYGARPALSAEPPRAEPATLVVPARLNASIDEVLAGREFQWRLRQPARAEDDEKDGPVKRFVRKGVELVKAMFRGLRRGWERFTHWLEGLFPKDEPAGDATEATISSSGSWVTTALYLLIAAALGLAAVVVYFAMKNATVRERTDVQARALEAAKPDLSDEGSHAGQLTTDGWLDLARAQLASGEWRLAWRALYLATLARLAVEGLVSLSRFKTNLDYEREVGRRALGRQDVVSRFADRRGTFEAVWYGNRTPDEAKARDWLAELERSGAP